MQDETTEQQPLPNFVKYLVLCGLIALFTCLYNVFSSKGVSYGFWGWVAIVIVTTIIPAACVTVANFLRTLAMPDLIITNQGMEGLLKAKIFWAVGPQCIGWFVGMVM